MLNYLTIILNRYKNLRHDRLFGEILSGSLLVFSSKIIGTIIGLGTSIIVARYYGSEIVGILALINSFFAITSIFTLLGTNTSILRLVPEYFVKYSYSSAYHVMKKIVELITIWSIIIGTILYFAADLISSVVFDRPDLNFLFSAAAIILVFRTLQIITRQSLRALKKVKIFALLLLIRPVLYFTLLLFFTIYFKSNYLPVYLQYFAIFIVAIISFVLMIYSYKTGDTLDQNYKSINTKTILKLSFPMFLTSSMTVIMGQVATIISGIYLSESDVGYYSIALKIAMLTLFASQAINTVIAPKFSELYHQNQIDDLFSVAKKSTKLIFWSLMPIILVFIIFGKTIIIFLYGIEFEASYPLLLILSFGLFINAISGSVGYFMNMCGYQLQFRNVMTVCVFLSFTLNIILIPLVGITGAAVATALVQVFLNLYLTYFIWNKFRRAFIYIPFLS